MLTRIVYKDICLIYVYLKKHYCPECKSKLNPVKISKFYPINSPEANYLDVKIDTIHSEEEKVQVIWNEFNCPKCEKNYTIDEMKLIEGKYFYRP